MVSYGKFRSDMVCPICHDVGNMYQIANAPNSFVCDTCGTQMIIRKGNTRMTWAKTTRTKPSRYQRY